MTDVASLLVRPEFPRSSGYDSGWMLENQMGPNAIWLMEWLTQAMALEPGMRVLDLGCGKAMTSIFLAREFGVRVWAVDLWITPDHNWRRAVEAGVGDLVCPLRAEAHALPFAAGFFDAVVSVDAYQYFGTDQLYLGYLSRFVRAGGDLGAVVVGLTNPIETVPAHLATPQGNGKVFWEEGCWSFKTAQWWHSQWSRCGSVADVRTDILPEGWRHWRDFERALECSGKSVFPSDAEALDADQGRTIGFVRALARRRESEMENFYDPSVGIRFGVDR
jgi:cyclopropane fatty-acyl-phospholipid synthase-like methyltransferase